MSDRLEMCPDCKRHFEIELFGDLLDWRLPVHACVPGKVFQVDRIAGPAPVDDPAPYRPGFDPGNVTRAEQATDKTAERRLTIAAQFMAAMMATREGESRMDDDLARVSLLSADALIARWKETT